MRTGQIRILIAAVALLLLVFSAWLAFEAMWASAGLGAFVDQWGARLPVLIDGHRWAQQLPQTALPDEHWFSDEVKGYVGHRLDRIMLAPLVTLVVAVALGCIALIPLRTTKAAAASQISATA